jgi:hypothetical protein
MSSCQECTACYDPGIEIGWINSSVVADGFYMGFAAYKATAENARKRWANYTEKVISSAQGQSYCASTPASNGCKDGNGTNPPPLPEYSMIYSSNSQYQGELESTTSFSDIQNSDGSVYTEKNYKWKESDSYNAQSFPGPGSCNGNGCTGPYGITQIGTPSSSSRNSGSVSYTEAPQNTSPCSSYWPYEQKGLNVSKSNTSQVNSYYDDPEKKKWCEGYSEGQTLTDEKASFSSPSICSSPGTTSNTTTTETSVTINYKTNTSSKTQSCSDSYTCSASISYSLESQYDVYEKSLGLAKNASDINMQSELGGQHLCNGYGGPRYGNDCDFSVIGSVLTHVNSLLTDEETEHYKYYDIYDGWVYPCRIQYQNNKPYVQVAKDVFDRIESFDIKLYFYVALTDINPCNGGEEDEDYISVKETTISCSAGSAWKTTEDHYYFLGEALTSDDTMPSGEAHYKETNVCYVVETINFKA